MSTARPHVLLARLDNDGDVLLTGPAVRAVAASSGRVTYLCSPRAAAAARLLPGVDEVETFDAPWIASPPPAVSREEVETLIGAVSAGGIDQAIIFSSFHQSPLPLALLLRLAGVVTIAAISVDYPGSLLDVRHAVSDDIHEVERNLSLVATLGYLLPEGDTGHLEVGRNPAAIPPGLVPEGPYVVVHPGASVPARAWSPAANRELVAALTSAGWRVVVTGGPSEADLCRFVAGETGLDLCGSTDLRGLAEIIGRAAAVVVGNTGPAHLAAAVQTPVVSIFAPTVPAVRWAPWKVPHVLLGRQDIDCAGCRAQVCPIEGQPCISCIPVADVVAAVSALTATSWAIA